MQMPSGSALKASSKAVRSGRLRPFVRRFKAMGSPCAVKLYATDKAFAVRCLDRVTGRVAQLEHRYSRFLSDNPLARVNAAAGEGRTHPIDGEFAALLDYADACHRASDGLFDITSGLLRKVWDFRSGRIPDQSEIDALLPRIGWHHVRWSRTDIEFLRSGMELDFGGLVKEYAADVAAGLLLEAGLAHGLVDLGGDIRVIGPHGDGRPWSIGLRHPRQPEAVLAAVDVNAGAIATSGDYERCIVIDGKRLSHILDPRTGWPVSGLASVSVIAPQCVVAGSTATIAMLKGGDGSDWLAQAGLPHIWMDGDGGVGDHLGSASAAL